MQSLPINMVRLNRSQLVALIMEKDVKLTWLACQIEVDRKTLYRWLRGTVTLIRRRNLRALASALGVEWEKLVG